MTSNGTMTRPGLEAGSIRVSPDDEHNRRLVAEVHPSDWTDPQAHDRYDMVVLGGGSGGLVSAAIAVAVGGRVALVERGLLGGDCLNSGCVPSKSILRSAGAWRAAHRAAPDFDGPAVSGEGSFDRVMERMRRIRADISPVDSARRFSDLGVHVFLGEGRFVGPDALEVNGQTLRFRRAVLATGGRPALPPIPGLNDSGQDDSAPHVSGSDDPKAGEGPAGFGIHTSETIFSLTERPEAMIVLGGGAIGCELSQAFARLGSQVTLLEAGPTIMGRDDPDVVPVVQASLEADGVTIRTGARASGVQTEADGRVTVQVEGDEALTADVLLVAAGRVPNVDGMGLEAAGVSVGKDGVEVDDRLRTSNRRIYAVGDVTPGARFTHAADAEARIAVPNALFFGRQKRSGVVIPRCTYTDPEVGHVGIEAVEAKRRGSDVQTITLPFSDVDRALTESDTRGFARVHLKAGSQKILGATVVGAQAGDLVASLSVAMANGRDLSDFGSAVYPYPTRAEVLRKLADAKRRESLTPRTQGIMRRVLGFLRKF